MATLNRHSARLDDDDTARADGAGEPQDSTRRHRSPLPQQRAAPGPGRTAPSHGLRRGAGDRRRAGPDESFAGGPLAAATTSPPQLSESAAVADALGIDGTVAAEPVDSSDLEQLAASRAERDATQAAAVASQVQTEQAAAAAKAEARRRPKPPRPLQPPPRPPLQPRRPRPRAADGRSGRSGRGRARQAAASGARRAAAASTAATAIAKISNSAGRRAAQAQAAADAVVSNVPGAAGITIGGTRASAADPGGHPSGLALDYMVGSNARAR